VILAVIVAAIGFVAGGDKLVFRQERQLVAAPHASLAAAKEPSAPSDKPQKPTAANQASSPSEKSPKPTQPKQPHASHAKHLLSTKRDQLLALANAERARYGVPPLQESAKLDKTAQAKAADTATLDASGHLKYEHTCASCLDGLQQAEDALGEGYGYYAENLDINASVPGAVRAWINSPPHHQAMINPRYTATGFGVAKDPLDSSQYLFTEHFYGN
jgi:uncharacterized protein YkwD